MERAGQPRPAIELEPFVPPAAPPSTGSLFAAGAAFGILVAAIAAQIWLAYNLDGMARWSFDETELRTLSALALVLTYVWAMAPFTELSDGIR